jgi:hypothetical protein
MVTLSEPNVQGEADQQTESDTGRSEPSPWYDLWAQSLMALWAFGQLILTGVGIWYIRKTLLETEAAVKLAGKGNDAAQAAVEVTREIGEAQVRCYVQITKVAMDYAGLEPVIVFSLHNSGQSPAANVALAIRYVVKDGDGDVLAISPANELDVPTFGIDIPSGQPDEIRVSPAPDLLAAAHRLGPSLFQFATVLTATDVFDKPAERLQFWSLFFLNGRHPRGERVKEVADIPALRPPPVDPV